MGGSRNLRLLLALMLLLGVAATPSGETTTETPSALLPLEARSNDGSGEEDVISTSYVLPNQIFNEGKPYYARQDPVSGQLDFSAKKPAGIQPDANEVVDPNEKIVLSGGSSPNIHDFLNLPVKYSSSKFVYPLVSSSYANLKYQGSNKNYITNKKPTSVVAPVTPPPPNYHSSNFFTVPTTKLTAVTPTAGVYYPSSPTSTSTTSTTSTTTTTTTTRGTLPPSRRPVSTTTTTEATSPAAKYTTTSRRPIPVNTVSTTQQPPRTSTTRKKFVPTKKYSPTVPIVSGRPTPSHGDQRPVKSSPRPTASSHDEALTTHHATPQAAIFPTEPATTTKMYTTSSTSPPVVFTEGPTPPPAFSPIPGTGIPNLDPADVYHTLGQKNTQAEEQQQQLEKQQQMHTQQQMQQQQQLYQQQQYQLQLEKQQLESQKHPYQQQLEKQQQQQQQQQHQQQHQQQQHQPQPPPQQQQPSPPKAPMTLSDIFNSLAEEESNVAQNYQQNQGFDAQGNLIQPIAPSKPSPFAMQQPGAQQPGAHQPGSQQRPNSNEQKVISGSQENYSNEYVSYQVQQPNMMQYRPVPGQINNVVISPGQQSASFVLGSQVQQVSVGHPSIEKEPMFAKDTPGVQYGQVINEDIGNIKRPLKEPLAPPPNYQQMPSLQQNSNFHQNGNVATSGAPATVSYQEPPPEAPSPYQQLPLIGSNKRPSKKPVANPEQPPHAYPTPQTSTPPQTQPTPPAVMQTDDTKELLVSTNIRFPAQGEDSLELASSAVMQGPPAGPHINGHAQPLSLQQIQNSNPVVFPKAKDEAVPGGVNVQIQQHEVLNLSQQKPQLKFPAQQQGLGEQPSLDMEPPPRYPTTLPMPHAPPTPGKRPLGPSPPSNFYNEFNRKPQNGPRPSNLPNILPQFRPNAKISSGHPPALKQEAGNIRLPQQGGPGPKRPYNPSVPPQFAHRRQPLYQQQMLQKRYPMNRISEYPVGPSPAGDVNRRVYRLPPYGGQNVPYLPDHMYPRRPHGPGPLRSVDGYPAERHAPSAEPYKTIDAEAAADFEEEDLVINDPPQPVTPGKDRKGVEETKLEPVVTLQMLQSQKKAVSLPGDDTGAGEIQVTADNDPQEAEASKLSQQKLDPSGMYVVFPMKSAEKGQNEGEAPSAPAEYQNTPFSVIRDQPQEPILKNKKPQSLQQQNKAQQVPKEKFPYPIEKPDPSYSELHPDSHAAVPGVLVAPRIITGALGTGTETPIAIAYTPTEPNPFRHDQGQKFSNINLATSVINEIRQDTQTEEGLSSDFDLRGQNFEKDFMAPFYPSVSLGGASGAAAVNPAAPSNWNILPSTTDQTVNYEKNSINRADVDTTEEKKTEEEQPTASPLTAEKPSDMDSFQPQLQGGFKPIYPPGYQHVEQVEQEEIAGAKNAVQDQPIALPLVATTAKPSTSASPIISSSSSSTSTSSTTSTTSTTHPPGITKSEATSATTKAPVVSTKPTQRKKSTFETSLAALLFGDDDEEDGARKSAELPKAQAGPRNVPRMGPRSLTLS